MATGQSTAVTKDDVYVSAYDIRGETIAYSTVILPSGDAPANDGGLADVTGKTLDSLVYPQSFNVADLNGFKLLDYTSTLHIQRNGKELPLSFMMAGRPLRLHIPTLSLSPDGKWLITVAPVHELPSHWEQYEPLFQSEVFSLKPGNTHALADDNLFQASQYVVVDLRSGIVSPLVDAPAGRVLAWGAPTKAFWFADSRRAVLSNTFLPLDVIGNAGERLRRRQAPAVAMIDIATRHVQPVAYIAQSRLQDRAQYRVSDISWEEAREQVRLRYTGSTGDDGGAPPPTKYRLTSGRPVRVPGPIHELLSVTQDLNHPPVLSGQVSDNVPPRVVWNPNPQLDSVSVGPVSVYRWQDRDGNWWSGLLALPPDYDPQRRYPLVIQTHGYNAVRFFADGMFTTGSGGRALVAKGMIVLQMDAPQMYLWTPKAGQFATAGFESAIEHLVERGLVDRSRVGVIGFSYTCSQVLYAITHRPELFAAASITDGVDNGYMQYLIGTDAGDFLQEQFERENGGRPFGDGLLAWLQNAPVFNLGRVQTPLLISALGRGQLLQQWENYAGLRRLGKPVDMVWFQAGNTPHVLVQPVHRYMSQQLAVDWFAYWLKGEKAPDTSKAPQYARWQHLSAGPDSSAARSTGVSG